MIIHKLKCKINQSEALYEAHDGYVLHFFYCIGCTFYDGGVTGGHPEEEHLGETTSEQKCAELVQRKKPYSTGAKWGTSNNKCYAEQGDTIVPSNGYRACLFKGIIVHYKYS